MISSEEVNELTQQYEEKLEAIEQELAKIRKQQTTVEADSKQKRTQTAYTLAAKLEQTEKQTRKYIDQQLALANWKVDTETIRYAKGLVRNMGKIKR